MVGSNTSPEEAHKGTGTGAPSPSVAGAPVPDKDAGSPGRGEQEKQKDRDKDERIACLQREMGAMEREFARELDKLCQNESETAAFWQAKHSALNQQFLRTDAELRVLRSGVDAREAERAELRHGWEMLRGELRERDDEIRSLKGQIHALKKFVSTSTRADDQTSDDVFGEAMAKLGNGLQNWVISNFRRANLVDFANLDEATLTQVSDLVPTYMIMYQQLAQGAKIHLLQSAVSRILVETVFESYFVGLSDGQTQQFRQTEELLVSLASDASVNQWRASTLAIIRRDAPQVLRDETALHVERVASRINGVLESVTTGSSRSEARDAGLCALVHSAVGLARLLVVQKAVLRVHMPPVSPGRQVVFDRDTMEDVGGEDEDALDARPVWCTLFPGVIKHGDESGGQMQLRNVIAKARVLCRPG